MGCKQSRPKQTAFERARAIKAFDQEQINKRASLAIDAWDDFPKQYLVYRVTDKDNKQVPKRTPINC